MIAFIASILVLVIFTVGATLLFKNYFFVPEKQDKLYLHNSSDLDKALLTKHDSVDVFKNSVYYRIAAAFIAILFAVVLVEYPSIQRALEEKADPKAVQSQTIEIQVTEQQPEKPKPKMNKPRRQEVVDEPLDIDSTDQEELEEFIPDFGEEEEEEEEEEVYVPPVVDRAEIRATFPGGAPAFMRWAYNNLNIPEEDKKKGVRGMVMVQFVVYEDGFVRDIKIVKGLSPSLDAAVKSLLNKSPKWTPAKTQGQVVRERWRYPIKIVPK